MKMEDKLKQNLSYDPKTGEIRYKAKRGVKKPGDLVGNYLRHGYKTFHFSGKQFDCHRVAWLLHYGAWPKHTIDHINRDKQDNRISNLRDITQAENNLNKPDYKRKHNLPRGVIKKDNLYQSRINIGGKTVSLGYYKCPVEAHQAYVEELVKALSGIR